MDGRPFAYFHGRFQPFHLGHLDVVLETLTAFPTLILGISNPFRSPPIITNQMNPEETESLTNARSPRNNPWPFWLRLLMIREGLLGEGVDLSRVIMIPNVNNTGLPVEEIQFPKELVTVVICPKDAHNRAIARHYAECGWDVRVVNPARNRLGSGEIRHRIRHDLEWADLVPAGTAQTIARFVHVVNW